MSEELLDKWQIQQKFWSDFGIPAYDQSIVPQDAKMPYITYQAATGNLEQVVNLSASVWYYDTSWQAISQKVDEIGDALSTYGYASYKIKGGYVWFTRGTPFAQRMEDENEFVRRIYLNVQAEFLTRS